MLIFKVFQLNSIAQNAGQAAEDPLGFSGRYVIAQAKRVCISFLLSIFSLLILTFILSYTHLIGGPYILAKFFFWLILLPSLFIVPFLIYIVRLANLLIKNKNIPKKVSSKII